MSPRPLGLITCTVLRAIRDGHRHGADIMHAIDQGGGTVYKVLRRLEERGLIEGAWEDAAIAEEGRRPRRRYYELTAAGVSELKAGMARHGGLSGEPVRRLRAEHAR